MSDLDRRLANLSPEKRRLFELLAEKRSAAARPVDPAAAPPLDLERFQLDEGTRAGKADIQEFYDRVSAQLDASPFGEHALFLNFGYVRNDQPQRSPIRVPEGGLNKNPMRLVLELIGDLDLRPDHDVLDVGCGRGGLAYVLRRFFTIRSYLGVDLSPQAIAFCARAHRHPGDGFEVGDAERLPVPDGAFDVITNLESSHNYPDMDAFFREVARALRPGGAFLYGDLIPAARIEERERALAAAGFVQERRQDVTANVLLSCDETASAHARAFRADNDRDIMAAFLGMPSSDLYRDMKSGQQKYLLYRLRRGG